jgi:hypothetical protein
LTVFSPSILALRYIFPGIFGITGFSETGSTRKVLDSGSK